MRAPVDAGSNVQSDILWVLPRGTRHHTGREPRVKSSFRAKSVLNKRRGP